MPVNYALYPQDWQAIRARILTRAHHTCECIGECGLHQPNPRTRRCTERQHTKAHWARGQVRLTIAHLCQCHPLCGNDAHLKALCQRCHLRVDITLHVTHRQQAATAKNRPLQTPGSTLPAQT